MGNGNNAGNGALTWRIVAGALWIILITISSYLYKRMEDKVDKIIAAQVEYQEDIIKLQERQNTVLFWKAEHTQEHKEESKRR